MCVRGRPGFVSFAPHVWEACCEYIYLTFFFSGRDKLAVDPLVWKRGEGKVGYWFVREDWSGKQEQGAIKTSFKKSFCFLREKK